MSHRLELAAKEALKLKEQFSEVLELHYHTSQKAWSLGLKLAAQFKIHVGVLTCTQTKAHATSFLPHLNNALNTLHHKWIPYVLHFSNVKEAKDEKFLAAKAAAWLGKLLDFKIYYGPRFRNTEIKNTSRQLWAWIYMYGQRQIQEPLSPCTISSLYSLLYSSCRKRLEGCGQL